MPNCTTKSLEFGRLGRRKIEGNFKGGDISSDGGLMLLREVDRKINLTKSMAAAIHDPRDPLRTTHTMEALVSQRILALASGYEDLNDHGQLRKDILLQTALGRDEELASSPTLSRLETRAIRSDIINLNRVLVEQFISNQKTPPKELILDIGASDIPLHGDQEKKEFHGYYDSYCYLPLYVYCGRDLLCCVLRPSRIDGAKHSAAVIKLLVTRLRQEWADTRFIVRGDSGFCRQRLIRWCERSDVGYVIGVAKNERLKKIVKAWESALERRYKPTGEKQRCMHEFYYGAKTWDIKRRIVTRLEFGGMGNNPRFVVTNLVLSAVDLYDNLYCKRGEAENRIKETQLDLFGTRTSCHEFLSNWLRVLFAGCAYTLMQRFKEMALVGTEFERATSATIRVKLLKIGVVVIRNTRRIRIFFSSCHPLRDVFSRAAGALAR
jgi:hypothetical protein